MLLWQSCVLVGILCLVKAVISPRSSVLLLSCLSYPQWTWRVFKAWQFQLIQIVSGRLKNSYALLVTFWLVVEFSLITLADHVMVSATSHLTLLELHYLSYCTYAVITIFLPRVRLKSGFKSFNDKLCS